MKRTEVILLLLSLCFNSYGEGMCKFGVEVGCDTFVVHGIYNEE